MTSDPVPKSCPSCHDGIVMSIERQTDGAAVRFSCGHTHHSKRIGDDLSASFSDHLLLEQRLGPHSSEPVTHSYSHGVDALVVSMQQEMYKDALYFFRVARDNHNSQGADPFVTWRNLRVAILFVFAAIESCINQFIDEHVERNKGSMSQAHIDYWTEKTGYISISRKLNEGIELFGGIRLDADSLLWKQFQELKDLRDALVHYKAANRLFYDTDKLLERTEKGFQAASAVIKSTYLRHPANSAYPKTFDDLP